MKGYKLPPVMVTHGLPSMVSSTKLHNIKRWLISFKSPKLLLASVNVVNETGRYLSHCLK